MKSKCPRALLPVWFFCVLTAQSQPINEETNVLHEIDKAHLTPFNGKKMNFFIISKRKKGRFDPATKYNILRTKIKSAFHGNNFASIVAKNGDDMSIKVIKKIQQRNATIGTIWFDSHGMYNKGYALFFIGSDEYSYKSAKDGLSTIPFKKLSRYTTTDSRIIIGSCYGGATFKGLTNYYKDTTYMWGDSLMIIIGKSFRNGVVYGSESWVMSRPGLFKKRMAVYGNPGRKIFHDTYYKPAWDSIGKWNKYAIASGVFLPANAISLNADGALIEHPKPYAVKKKYRKQIKKIIATLQPRIIEKKS